MKVLGSVFSPHGDRMAGAFHPHAHRQKLAGTRTLGVPDPAGGFSCQTSEYPVATAGAFVSNLIWLFSDRSAISNESHGSSIMSSSLRREAGRTSSHSSRSQADAAGLTRPSPTMRAIPAANSQ